MTADGNGTQRQIHGIGQKFINAINRPGSVRGFVKSRAMAGYQKFRKGSYHAHPDGHGVGDMGGYKIRFILM
jgi:hypothetical protein